MAVSPEQSHSVTQSTSQRLGTNVIERFCELSVVDSEKDECLYYK